MKFLISVALILGGICGVAISIMGNTVVDSPLLILNGLELSLSMGIFSIIAFLGGVILLVST